MSGKKEKEMKKVIFLTPYPFFGSRSCVTGQIWALSDSSGCRLIKKLYYKEKAMGQPVKKLHPVDKRQLWLEAFRSVIERDHPVGLGVILKDSDLIHMTNDILEEGVRINVRTFERWKAGELEDGGFLAEFRSLYERVSREQLLNLFTQMMDKEVERSWTKYAWVIERKYDEWNLRSKSVDETARPRQLVLRVKGGGEK